MRTGFVCSGRKMQQSAARMRVRMMMGFMWWQPVTACSFKTQHLPEEDRWGKINDGRSSSYTDAYERRPEALLFVFRIKFQLVYVLVYSKKSFISNYFINTWYTWYLFPNRWLKRKVAKVYSQTGRLKLSSSLSQLKI